MPPNKVVYNPRKRAKMTVFDDETLDQLRGAYRYQKDVATLAADFDLAVSSVYRYSKLGFRRKARSARGIPKSVKDRRNLIKKIVSIKVTSSKGRVYRKHGSAAQVHVELNRRHKEDSSSPQASVPTIIRDLHFLNFHSKKRRKLCSRERVHVEKRAAFKEANCRRDWKRIVFSDETWVSTKERTGEREWCEEDEQPNPIEDKGRRNLDSFQVFAAVGWNYKSPLILFPKWRIEVTEKQDHRYKVPTFTRRETKKAFTITKDEYMERSLDSIRDGLKEHQVYLKKMNKGSLLFQEDGARAHVAHDVRDWFEEENINRLPNWPPYSPDLNMIEKVWKLLHAAIGKRCPETEEELIEAAQEAWEKDITQEVINKCCKHFKKAVQKI